MANQKAKRILIRAVPEVSYVVQAGGGIIFRYSDRATDRLREALQAAIRTLDGGGEQEVARVRQPIQPRVVQQVLSTVPAARRPVQRAVMPITPVNAVQQAPVSVPQAPEGQVQPTVVVTGGFEHDDGELGAPPASIRGT